MKTRYISLLVNIFVSMILTIIVKFVDHNLFVMLGVITGIEMIVLMLIIGFDLYGIRKGKTILNIEQGKQLLEFEKMEILIKRQEEMEKEKKVN